MIMKVCFSLDPIDSIQPWGKPPNLSLSWFALSLGKYSITLGDFELLHYSADVVAAIQAAYPSAYPGPQIGYQVVRLHEDLLDIAADVVEPVTKDVAVVLERHTAVKTMRRGRSLAQNLGADDPAIFGIDALVDCLGARQLDTGYLAPAPLILLWRHANEIHVEWDGRGQMLEGLPAWMCPAGHACASLDQFREALKMFHDDFTGQMSDRVASIGAGWKRPEVRIDIEELHRSQNYREKQLGIALSREPATTDWDAVREGARRCWCG
jgi:hypothetical protein